MKNVVAGLCTLILVGAVAWLLFGKDDLESVSDDDVVVTGTDDDPAPEEGLEAEAPDLTGTGTGRSASPRGRGGRYPPGQSPFKPKKLRTGTLEVLPIGPEGETISADRVTVKVTSAHSVTGGVHGKRDRESGLWTFEEVPIGRARIVLFGDNIAEHEQGVLIRESVTTYQKVSVMRGAMVHYTASLGDGTVPKKVTAQLVDHRGIAASVRWQVRTAKTMTSARRAKSMSQGPDGNALAIPPGRYTLKLRAATGETGEVAIVLAPGDREDVAVTLRR